VAIVKKPETYVEQFQLLLSEKAKSLSVFDVQVIVHYKKLILSSMTMHLLLFIKKNFDYQASHFESSLGWRTILSIFVNQTILKQVVSIKKSLLRVSV